MLELNIIFGAAIMLIFYAYAGYPLVLALLPHLNRYEPINPEITLPGVTLIIPAYNEERWIARKIENTLALDYPRERLEVFVASDGSTDKTVEIARKFAELNIKVIAFTSRQGKQEMLNRLVPLAKGEIVVMTDTNALLAQDALEQLVHPFNDPQVGCVIGRRVCVIQRRSIPSLAESFYWRYESWIKLAESQWHSCLAATGQLYAVRRSVFPHVERVGEDFYIPMKVLAATGRRIAYVPTAIATIPAAASLAIEFERKTRAHVAFLISLPLLSDLLIPGRTPVWWQFISHHVLRMLVPPAMLAAFIVSYMLASTSTFYFYVMIAQILFYGFAVLGWIAAALGRRPKIFYLPFYFVFVQMALAQSWIRWPRGKFDYAWQRTERLTDAN